MSLVISRNLVLSATPAADSDLPLIGWQNRVVAENITADTEDTDHPAVNLANPQTFSYWLAADSTEQYVTIVTGTTDDIDYLAIGPHNLASKAVPVSVEGQLNDGDWTELVQDVVLDDDGPALFQFEAQPLTSIRIKLQAGDGAARIAVAYVGKLLVMERRIYVGVTPFPFGEVSEVTNGRSESGEFLGRIVTSERIETKVPFAFIGPTWYRTNMVPFITAARNKPFFFAWRPGTYPREVGYAWLATDPVPVNSSRGGLMAFTLDLSGVA